MPMERMSMRHVRECLRLKSAGISTREIARRVGVASSTVRLTLRRCEVAGIACPLDARCDAPTAQRAPLQGLGDRVRDSGRPWGLPRSAAWSTHCCALPAQARPAKSG
jgi:transposase